MKMEKNYSNNFSIKNFFINFFIVFLSIFVILLIFEIFLRVFSLASTSSLTQPINKNNPIPHFKPNHQFRNIQGWDAYINVTHKTNNFGYNTSIDFNKNEEVNCVIGDSYVEALQIDSKNSFHGILNNKGFKVYAIGISGSSLSDYIAFYKFAFENFNCKKYIFIIIENDFEQSLRKIVAHHYFEIEKNGQLDFVIYEPSRKKILLRKFALINYIYKNMKITSIDFIFDKILNYKSNNNQFKIINLDSSKKAIDYFFMHLKLNKIDNKNILFVIDGDRRSIYENKLKKIDNISESNKYFIQKSVINNIKYIDLQTIFNSDFKKNKKMFNFNRDYHWNEYGHSIVADQIINSNFLIID